jgi:hypothetical protein
MGPKPLKFVGSSLDDLRNFPEEAIELARKRLKEIGGDI